MTYPSPAFREDRVEVLHAAIRELHFGLLVTHPADGFATSYLPWELDAERGPCGTLVGHLARYNPQPSWYTCKSDDPLQVPTWDYLSVESRGTLKVFDDQARLHGLLARLVDRNEAGREHRWYITDAPDDYVREQMRYIVGIELEIDSLVGRYKLSQNRDAADQEGARAGLAAAPTERERELAKAISATQRERRDR